MKFDRFTERARQVMELGGRFASLRGHLRIDTQDVLLAMIRGYYGVGGCVLQNLGVDISHFDFDLALLDASKPKRKLSPRVKQLIKSARDEAGKRNHCWIGTEHLLLGICCIPECDAHGMLIELGLEPDNIRQQIDSLIIPRVDWFDKAK